MTKTQKIIYYVLLVLVSALFLMASWPKFTNDAAEMKIFTDVNLPLWFMYFVGVCEVLGVIGLWLSKFQKWAAWGLQGIMVGAFVVTCIEMGFLPALGNVAIIIVLFFIVKLGKQKTHLPSA